MKSLPKPRAADVANLRSLTRNYSLASRQALSLEFRNILASYCSYRRASGNAKSANAPHSLRISTDLKKALISYYNSPPTAIKTFLRELRRSGSPDVCPMCGSPKSGTLDHIFPKEIFPELSIFSLNVVPACDCNTKRRSNFVGTAAGERVLHPYFDQIFQQRLVMARFAQTQYGYERPLISVERIVTDSPALKYHVDNVLSKTNVLNHFDATWPKLTGRPEDYFTLPSGKLSPKIFRNAVMLTLQKYDRHFGTPNNWESMLISGVLADNEVSRFLLRRTREIRLGIYLH